MARVSTASPRPTWARERLWLGMSNVGSWVLIAVALLWARPYVSGVDGWFALVGLLVAVQIPFDVVGGYVLPHRHRRWQQPASEWVRAWMRGVVLHSALLGTAGAALLVVHERAGVVGSIGLGLAAMMMTAALQLPLFRAATGHAVERPDDSQAAVLRSVGLASDRVRVVDSVDPGFVGGWTGLPGREVLVVPKVWFSPSMSRPALRAQLFRRRVALSSGQRTSGLVLGFAWNAAGFTTATLVFGAADPSALLATLATFALWSFLGLLILPTPSRAGVLTVDQLAARAGAPMSGLTEALTRLEVTGDDEPERSELVESIFHPVPALSRRLRQLRHPSASRGGAWHAARMALLLALPFSPLSRAVHCNVGRPELWAMYPGD